MKFQIYYILAFNCNIFFSGNCHQKMVKKIQHIQVSASKRFVPLKNSRRDSSSSELSSTEYLTSSSSELSSFASITTCDCLTGCSNKCDYLVYINKEERKMAEISQTRKKLSKRRKPSEMPTTALKKLGSNKNSKKKTHEVPKSTLQNSHHKSKYIII